MLIHLSRRAASTAVLGALLSAVSGVTASEGLGAPASSSGALHVSEKVQPSNSHFMEGAVEFIKLRRMSDGKLILQRQFELGQIHVSRRLSPGSYRLTSWTQACSGNCDHLDPPSGDCRRTLRVKAGKTLRVTVVSETGKHCRIAV